MQYFMFHCHKKMVSKNFTCFSPGWILLTPTDHTLFLWQPTGAFPEQPQPWPNPRQLQSPPHLYSPKSTPGEVEGNEGVMGKIWLKVITLIPLLFSPVVLHDISSRQWAEVARPAWLGPKSHRPMDDGLLAAVLPACLSSKQPWGYGCCWNIYSRGVKGDSFPNIIVIPKLFQQRKSNFNIGDMSILILFLFTN